MITLATAGTATPPAVVDEAARADNSLAKLTKLGFQLRVNTPSAT